MNAGYFRPTEIYSLIMRRDGELAFVCNHTTWWSTHTHVAGSALTLLHNGNLVVRTPRDRIVWRRYTGGSGRRTLLDGWRPAVVTQGLRIIWAARLSHSGCR